MKQNDFDKLVTENYDQGEFEYNPANWDKMAGQLDAEKEKKRRFVWLPLMSIAASLLAVISIAGWLMTRSGNTAEDAAILAAKEAQTKMVPTKPVVPVTPKVIEPAQAPASENAIATNTTAAVNNTANNNIIPVAHTANNRINSVTNNYKPVYGRKAAPLLPMASLALEQGQPAPVLQESRLHMAEKETNTRPSVFGSSVAAKPQIDLAATPVPLINGDIVNAYQPEENVKANRVMISLSGGINYGSLNRGYAMGFNAHTRVGQRFYVEGDLALVNNMGGEKDQYIPITQGNSLASFSRSTSNTPTTTPATTPKAHFYNLFYAQLTPTFGATVYKHLSVGAGADFQRLLQNNSLMTITNNSADAKEVPLYDMGLVGKTEYAITREVKASVLYRKGFNNFLYSSDKYVDRDYIQFQLKFTILKR